MIKQDYILRMIEQLVRVLHYALGLSRKDDFKGGLKALDDAFTEFFGWDSNFVNSMPEEYLIQLLRTGERLDVNNLTVLAILLKAEGDIYARKEEPTKAYHRHLRALHLFLTADESGTKRDLPDEYDQTAEVVGALESYQLPQETLRRLWRYHERHDALASAEDTLWELLQRGEEGIVAEGIAFYRRLLARSDADLEAGGLPRAEIEESLAELAGE